MQKFDPEVKPFPAPSSSPPIPSSPLILLPLLQLLLLPLFQPHRLPSLLILPVVFLYLSSSFFPFLSPNSFFPSHISSSPWASSSLFFSSSFFILRLLLELLLPSSSPPTPSHRLPLPRPQLLLLLHSFFLPPLPTPSTLPSRPASSSPLAPFSSSFPHLYCDFFIISLIFILFYFHNYIFYYYSQLLPISRPFNIYIFAYYSVYLHCDY
jgi:hypothetical protein